MQLIEPLIFRTLSTQLLYPTQSSYVAKKHAPLLGAGFALLPSLMSDPAKLKGQVAVPVQTPLRSRDFTPAKRHDQALSLKVRDSPRNPCRHYSR